MKTSLVPQFAIIGHPNEGKSSVVSTLTENDSVKISSVPGETRYSHTYPIMVNGSELIRFVDTPGFQNPAATLKWIQNYSGPAQDLLQNFVEEHRWNTEFRDECEIFYPIMESGGVIYVADASRPLRRIDRMEMEILRLTGLPRMAILNIKTDENDFIPEWKAEFRKNFNQMRVFNAFRGTYAERIALLESLRSIDQDWYPVLTKVVDNYKKDWEQRNEEAAVIIERFLSLLLTQTCSGNCTGKREISGLKTKLSNDFKRWVSTQENIMFNDIRTLFRHKKFKPRLAEHSILDEDIFSEDNWKLLGLTSGQITALAALAGAGFGAIADLAAAGLSFGIFTGVGSVIGAGSMLWQGTKLLKIKVIGLKIGGYKVDVGPVSNPQLPFILLDRAFVYYGHIANWAHARREEKSPLYEYSSKAKIGRTSEWNSKKRETAGRYFNELKKGKVKIEQQKAFLELLHAELLSICTQEPIRSADYQEQTQYPENQT